MIDSVIQTLVDQATHLRSTNYAVERCDPFLYYIGISFKKRKIVKVIAMYEKALVLLDVHHDSPVDVLLFAAQWTHEIAVLQEQIYKPEIAGQTYIKAATYYYYGGYKTQMNSTKMLAFSMSAHCHGFKKHALRAECYYLDALDKYDNGMFIEATTHLIDAIKETTCISELSNSGQFIKLYEKLVYICLMHLNKPNTAMMYCDEIIRRSSVHADFYKSLKNKIIENDSDGINNMLLMLKNK